MADDFRLRNEIGVHGKRWHTMHNCYFADPEVALPFIDTISHEILNFKPSVVADLGGGNGFILSELAKRHPETSIRYINVDISPEQLRECKYDDITSLQTSAEDITRGSLVKDDSSLMFIMRSLLHYLGYYGVTPFLKHLRAQMKPGETMIHQTACFESYEDADCANHLYALMRTPKWYPTVTSLTQTLIETGWQVLYCKPAPNLCLKSPELAERYDLSAEDITHIRKEIGRKYNRPMVFISDDSNFTAFLHYRIFTCRAG
ncbi:class I SAM-dependent methyltransferase [Chloroflexota bacterium]